MFYQLHLGKLTGHLPANKTHARNCINLPQPQAGSYANGESHHWRDYQQLLMTDA
jgi:hypothetical protein